MKTKTINQMVTFRASAHEVYEALMDSGKHSEFTDSACSISREVNGEFSAYDGYIEGINKELVSDEKIVQSWRATDWPENHYSQVTFLLDETGDVTSLTFTQTGVPEDYYDDIFQGWHDSYWTPMREMLEK